MSLVPEDKSPRPPAGVDPRLWLRPALRPLEDVVSVAPGRSDYDLMPGSRDAAPKPALRPAAVLVPLVDRPSGLTVLLTRRSDTLNSHAGQVAFPGGRIDDTDRDAVAAAMREAHEEIGVTQEFITPVGLLDSYETGTGFIITPVVGVLRVGFTTRPNPGEVDEIFETPFSFLMDVANHQLHSAVWQGRERRYYSMPYQGYNIWGATAGMIVNLRDRLADMT